MQPRSVLPYRDEALKKLQKKLHVTKLVKEERDKDPAYALELPHEIGLKLTNRCDLRCAHCFQWNEEGYHNHLEKQEVKKDGDLDINIIKELLEKTRTHKANLYLWGGEPLMYSHWDELVQLLKADPRDTVICTNGLSIKRKLNDLVSISEGLTILISIEGLEAQHDNLRGKNTYRKIMAGVEELLQLQAAGIYKGFISVAAVVSDELVPHLFDFCMSFEEKGIDTLYINYPWYIPDDVAFGMDELFKEKYGWMGTDRGWMNSWHSFHFKVNSELHGALMEQLEMIRNKNWKMRVRFQPELEDNEVMGFIEGSTKPGQHRTRCLGISNRIDLMPNGVVTPCKKFPEFIVGNMNSASLEEVWQGEGFKKFRTLHNNTLMPICSKCEILYMNGI